MRITAVDGTGCNPEECDGNIKVIDRTPPTITCPTDITIDTDPYTQGARVTYQLPGVSGNCAPSSPALIEVRFPNLHPTKKPRTR